MPGSLPGVRKRGEPLERVDEMLRWIETQRMPDGGWHSKNRFGLDGGLRLDWDIAGIPEGDVASTALVGVTLLRTRDAKDRTPYHKTLVQAIDYVKAAVAASPSNTADLTGRVTPISARVGTYIDTALALLLLAEAAFARTPTDGGPVGAQIEKLIRKLESSQKIQGNWGEGAHNAPLLGHALAVWGLESASRNGHKVDPGVLALAGKWALGKDAERAEAAAAGKWQTKERGLVPRWLERDGTEDDEPINYELYAAAARLSVLAQADRSNRALETQLLLAARTGGDVARRAEAARSLEAVKRTRASLHQAQQAVAATLTKERGAAPCLFAAEDFIACLLIADSLPPRYGRGMVSAHGPDADGLAGLRRRLEDGPRRKLQDARQGRRPHRALHVRGPLRGGRRSAGYQGRHRRRERRVVRAPLLPGQQIVLLPGSRLLHHPRRRDAPGGHAAQGGVVQAGRRVAKLSLRQTAGSELVAKLCRRTSPSLSSSPGTWSPGFLCGCAVRDSHILLEIRE